MRNTHNRRLEPVSSNARSREAVVLQEESFFGGGVDSSCEGTARLTLSRMTKEGEQESAYGGGRPGVSGKVETRFPRPARYSRQSRLSLK